MTARIRAAEALLLREGEGNLHPHHGWAWLASCACSLPVRGRSQMVLDSAGAAIPFRFDCCRHGTARESGGGLG